VVEPRYFSFGEKPLQFYVPGRIPYEEVTNMGHVTCTLRVRIRVGDSEASRCGVEGQETSGLLGKAGEGGSSIS
jgi:hypothetical protein